MHATDRLTPAVQAQLAHEIAAAGGREVCFVATCDPEGRVSDARVVARGTLDRVLALPGVARRGQMILHNHPGGDLEPSHADLNIAARFHDDGVGFGIIDNEAGRLYVVVEVPASRPEVRLDAFAIVGDLAEHGPVARGLGQYEDRPSQRDMAAHIADAYNDGGVVLLEAGTGVGKSFAYLVPALRWAQANGERTVVSTNTINLQEQLVSRDLPLLREVFGTDEWRPSFALLKGWRNYLCLARLDSAAAGQQSLLEESKLDELGSIG
jgi:ATP-dependent DNA helicase DinG